MPHDDMQDELNATKLTAEGLFELMARKVEDCLQKQASRDAVKEHGVLTAMTDNAGSFEVTPAVQEQIAQKPKKRGPSSLAL